MSVRARIVGAALVVTGLVGGGAAWAGESSRAEAAAPSIRSSDPTPALGTPVLSARRVPAHLVAPQAQRRLLESVGPILGLLPTTTCFEVRDANRRILVSNPDVPFAPASNQKLLTGWTALQVFGPDHTFTTRFATTAPPVGGVVEGDLWVIGGGDPLIDSEAYQSTIRWGRSPHTSIEEIGDRFAELGISRISGSVFADDSYYDNVRTVETWPDRFLSQGQVGPLSALAVNDGRTYAVVGPNTGVARVATDPAGWAAEAFRTVLAARGVQIGGGAAGGVAPDGLTTVLEVPSLPVREIVAEMLRFSDNNTAELLLKAIGREVRGEGSTAAGIEAMTERLATLGVDMSGVVVRDGSGLDEGNRVTCELIQAVLNDDGPDGLLAAGLAVGGGDTGTLRDRFRSGAASGRVRAKTGTLRWVSALSGWVETANDVDLSFSTIVNTPGGSVSGAQLSALDRIVEQLTGYPDAVDPALVGPKPVTP